MERIDATPGKRPVTLHGVSETSLIPLYHRALETQRRDALLCDEKALAIVRTLDYDLSRLKVGDQAAVMLRAREFDRRTREFLWRHPEATVVDIGCGLDTRFYRVDNGRVVWRNLDFPEVIALRQELLDEKDSARLRDLSCSALDPAWMEALSADCPCDLLFLAEGVLPYLPERDVRQLIVALRDHFPGSEVVFDAMSPLLRWLHNLELRAMHLDARLQWAVQSGLALEEWGEGIRLLDTWYYFDRSEPRLGFLNLFRYVPLLRRAAVVLHYRLGSKPGGGISPRVRSIAW